MPRQRLHLGALAALLFLVPTGALYWNLSRPSNIWWTPPGMALSLRESQDRVEIYVHGQVLQRLLGTGQVLLAGEAGASTLEPAAVTLRFNNWDHVRVGWLPMLLIYAAIVGAGAVLFILIATNRLAIRPERASVAT